MNLTKSLWAGLGLCLTGVAIAAGSTSHPSFWRYAHPEAKVLVGVEWHRLAGAALVDQLKKELPPGLTIRSIPNVGDLEMLKNIERVFLSSPGAPKGKKETAKFVAAIQGRFDLTKVRQFIVKQGAAPAVHRGVALLISTKRNDDQCMALVSPQVLLVGNRAAVQAALDHHAAASPHAQQNKLYHRAGELSAANDVWVVGTISPADLAGSDMPQAQMLKDVESFEAGLTLQTGLGLQVSLNTRTGEGAKALDAAIQGIMALVAMQGQDDPQAAEFLKKLKITSDQSRVSVAISVDQAELEKGIRSFRARAQRGEVARVDVRPTATGVTIANAGPATAPAPAEPARPQVIRIFGAEGGPREITLEPKRPR
ncbi:MAG: hypothetical protein ACRD44_09825 [Bryobacteraceae bacterium]